jgi:hypothetical protein
MKAKKVGAMTQIISTSPLQTAKLMCSTKQAAFDACHVFFFRNLVEVLALTHTYGFILTREEDHKRIIIHPRDSAPTLKNRRSMSASARQCSEK